MMKNLKNRDFRGVPRLWTAIVLMLLWTAAPALLRAQNGTETPTAVMEDSAVPAQVDQATPQNTAAVAEEHPNAGVVVDIPLLDSLKNFFLNPELLGRILNVGLTILVGIVLISLLIGVLKRIAHKRLDPRSSDLIIKIIQWAGVALIVINALKAAKVDLNPLLGAAGIVGIALGFAAQTSVSNFISGFFLVSEKAFTVGDILTIDNLTGVVFSIDTLSIKLRAFDNRLIRIPNETLIKANMINLTRFPVRRLNITLTVPYDTDVEQAKNLLLDIADRHPTVLRNPEPFFMIQSFGKEGVDLFLGVWFVQSDWEPTNNGMFMAIKQRFDEAGIRFAYPTFNLATQEDSRSALRQQAVSGPAGSST
ncbi:MAG: mechanosensitive ion channel family protein [Spirochaetes bacterium]|nr:mechanosensitive ion channel family protein [Spirochaetota bacterium]